MPLIVIALFAISAATGDSGTPTSTGEPSALSFPAPPNIDSQSSACAKTLAQLPVMLTGLDPRVVHTKPETPYVVAWGDPAIVLRCGVARPKSLHPGSGALYTDAGGKVAGPYYDVTTKDGANVYTTVDRAAYVSITVPQKYHAAPIAPLSDAILKALPAVCNVPGTTGPAPPTATLCTHRK